jgi:hypothetical protein
MKKTFWLFLCLLIIFIFKLELSKLGTVCADPARDLSIAFEISKGINYPLIGPVTGGILHSGPLFFYVLSFPFLIANSLQPVLVFISLLQTVGVFYCYLWGKLFFNENIGKFLLCLMSVDILTNFTLWQMSNPVMVFPVGVAFNYHLSRAILNKESTHLLLSSLLFILAIQFHLLFLIFLPFLVFAFSLPILRRKRILVYSFITLMIAMSPWFYHQIHTGFSFLKEAFDFSKEQIIDVIPFFPTLKEIPTLMLKQIFWNPYVFWGVSQEVSFPLKHLTPILLGLVSLLTLFGTGLGVIEVVRKREKRFALIFAYLLTLWVAIPFLRYFTAWYYFIPVQWIWMALAAYGVCYWTDRIKFPRREHIFKAALAGFVAVVGFSYYQVFKDFKEDGFFHAPWNVLYSVIDLRKPFHMGSRRVEFPYLGILEEASLARWAAQCPGMERFHGAILYELSLSRNSLYQMERLKETQGMDSKDQSHYIGILKGDLERYSYQPNTIYQAGAMIIHKTTPKVDYSSIKISYVEQEGWFKERFDDNDWTSLVLPVYTAQNPVEYPPALKKRWKEEVIFLRMNLSSATVNQPLYLGVGFPSWDPFSMNEEIEKVYLNGNPIGNYRKTAYGWIIPLSPDMKKGEQALLALKLRLNKWSDLDIYTW